VSVDFTVPVEHRDDLRLSEREWIVPLALLAKRELLHFDLRMEDDAGVPLLRAEETQLIARELLYLMFELDADGVVDPAVARLMEEVLAAGPRDAAALDFELVALERRLGPLPTFVALAGRLARGFLLCAVVDDVSRRRVVKFAYDEPISRPD